MKVSALFRLAAALALTTLTQVLPAPDGQSHAASLAADSSVARVRFIVHGLGVQPPHQGFHGGHVKDPLFQQYALQTRANQKATIDFRDGTAVHFNQNTQAVLASPHLTQVQRGEVAEILAPGTDHRVQTNSAVASAIGTMYDVRTDGSTTVFVVLHGALQVSNTAGTVVVKSNHQTTVKPRQAPSPPIPVDARAVFAWTDGLPTPDLGEDIALDANGGRVVRATSQREGTGDVGKVGHIDDGLLSQGWESAQGQAANQTVTVGFFGNTAYRVSSVIIDPAATYGDPASEDLKDFEIRISTGSAGDSAFTTVLRGTCRQSATLQRFDFPLPVRAKYVQLVALSNYGSPNRVAVAEWEVVATASLFAQPNGIARDSHGNLYVTDTHSDRINKLSPSGKLLAHWGSKGILPGQMLSPQGIAVDRSNNVYVVDAGNGRIEKFSSAGRLQAVWSGPGLDRGQLENPAGIAVDGLGNVYVSDETGGFDNGVAYANGRIQKFSPAGTVVAAWTDMGSAGPLDFPGGMTFDRQGNLIVADTVNNRLVKLSPLGTVLATYGASGSGAGQFSWPTDVAADAAGNLYVTDSFNNRVERIAPSGQATVWGAYGQKRGQFAVPGGLTTGAKGTLYVADTGNGRIQQLVTATGKVRTVWGKFATIPDVLGTPGGIAIDPRGNLWVTDSVNDRVQERSTGGHVEAVIGYHGVISTEKNTRGLGQFWYPHGIAVDNQGEIYVADTGNTRIQELAPRGPIGAIDLPADAAHPFIAPEGVAVDGAGNVYVADTGSNRLEKFNAAGALLWATGTRGTGPGQFEEPMGVAIDHEGDVFVSDFIGGRIQKYTGSGQLLATWGRQDLLGESRFFGPAGMTVDSHDHLYVADGGHGAVQELSTDGKLLHVFPLPGASTLPNDVAVDAAGTMYVTDSAGRDIVKLSPSGQVLAIWT